MGDLREAVVKEPQGASSLGRPRRRPFPRGRGGGPEHSSAGFGRERGVRYARRPVTEPSFPDAVAPERRGVLPSQGLQLALHEWGDPAAPAVVLCHGFFDCARGFDRLAPRLAERFRVVALDARGHGDSDWADAYGWTQDLADILNVLRWLDRPARLVGHSRGGGQVTDVAVRAPERVRQVVNIDGFGPPEEGFSIPGGEPDRRPIPERFAGFLDLRRRASERDAHRLHPALDDLVARRRHQNPRLSLEWLRYFVFHAARREPGGWRWKSDPHVTSSFGPWRPEWIGPGWKGLRTPLLAVTGSEPDSWGIPSALVDERLSHVPDVARATVADAGHFVHMERPAETAELLLSFLDD